jgi:predicted transcriptional regulator
MRRLKLFLQQDTGYLLRLPPKLKVRVKEYCEDTEMKQSEVIYIALREYLDRQANRNY